MPFAIEGSRIFQDFKFHSLIRRLKWYPEITTMPMIARRCFGVTIRFGAGDFAHAFFITAVDFECRFRCFDLDLMLVSIAGDFVAIIRR